jgi:5-enolpyruvylshikimate-3-phosphate synthase
VKAVAEGDDLHVPEPTRSPRGKVITEGDHRIAMAFSVLGKVKGARITVDNPECSEVSFPAFHETLSRLAAPRSRLTSHGSRLTSHDSRRSW